MMIAIIDYGVGNLFSLNASLKKIGVWAKVTSDFDEIRAADRLILPGVGAFADAAEKLRLNGLDALIKKEVSNGKEILGICLGMQLLFEESYEYGTHKGLGLLKGRIVPMEGKIPSDLKIPHIGWNSLNKKKNCPLLRKTKDGDYVYFVHSFFAEDADESLAATTMYGIEMTAAVQKDNVAGCQFHPEKSGEAGLDILEAFCRKEGEK